MSIEKVTSIDVAKLAGVSQSAVSRAFSKDASVSNKTAEKVRKAADELGYKPNALARSLITGKSKIIGLVVAYLDNHFYPIAIEKLSTEFQKQGYHLLIFMAEKTAGNVDHVVEEILSYQVDAIILASVALSSDLTQQCMAADVPIVLFNRAHDDETITAVTSDNYAGGAKVADYLLQTNHKRIAYIAGWEGASTQRDREAGFVDALHAAGKTLYAREIGNYIKEDAQAAARALCALSPLPDAIFVANDHMACVALDVIRFEFGLSVPKDISVVGYDDVPHAAWPAYDLTTVRQPANQMVQCTVEAVLDKITGKDRPTSQIKIDGPLLIRGSSRPMSPNANTARLCEDS